MAFLRTSRYRSIILWLPRTSASCRSFSSSSSPSSSSSSAQIPSSVLSSRQNRIYTSIRRPSELETLLLLSASSARPLLTLWTASWCPSCKTVAPLVKKLIEGEERVGEKDGGKGVGYVEVEMDAPENGELGMRYLITSLPTLLAFAKQQPRLETKMARLEQMKDITSLRKWIENEAMRHA